MEARTRTTLAVLALATWTCGGSTPPTIETEAAPEPSSPAMTAETAADRPLRLGEPLTLRLELDEDLLAEIEAVGSEAASERTLRLTLEDLVSPAEPVHVRIFVNTPGADAATSLDEPGYVSDVGFFPTGGEAAADSFLLDLGAALEALPAERRTLEDRFVDVTLIALPADDQVRAEGLEPVEVPLGRIRLSAHPAPADDGDGR